AGRLADEELAPFEVRFHVEAEAVRIDRMPGAGRDAAQVLDREAACVADPHLLVDPDLELVDVLLEVADHRGRLIADLTRAQGLGDPGHRLQLLTDAEPVGSCGWRHLAGVGNPGAGGLAGEEMIAAHFGAVHDLAQRALEAEPGRAPHQSARRSSPRDRKSTRLNSSHS